MSKKFESNLTRSEITMGIVFFPVYMLVLPFLVSYICLFLEKGWSVSLEDATVNLIYYYVIFAVALLIFRRFLKKSFEAFSQNLWGSLVAIMIAYICYFGANFIVNILLSLLPGGLQNINNSAIVNQAQADPRATTVMVLFLSPFVEEILFRGFVFGGLREKNRILAYVVSALLFGLLHVWQYVFATGDFSYLITFLQYVAPAVALAWCYEKAGNIWAPMGLHMLINAAALVILFAR